MHQVLSVAEKPSVAKELANIIGNGRGSSRNGKSRFNRLYDVGECEVGGGLGKCEMTITSVLGHVMDIDFTEAHKSWQGGPKLEELFDAPIRKQVKAESVDLVYTLQTEARRCSVLMLWLDGDLEGENISYEVLGLCHEVNPRMRVLRARFSALIPRDIFRTLRNPDVLNPNMNDAICARQEIDLRVGAAFTRFLTLRCQNRYEGVGNNGVVSYGPCQFPTLGFVVDRYFKVKSFVPEKFWSLSCEMKKISAAEGAGAGAGVGTPFHWQRGNVFDRFSVTVLFDLCVQNAGRARVVDVSGSASKRHRPPPLNTVALQMKASQYCRMSSAETMEVAEKLYQQGVLSYPRTETDYFKEGTELMALIEEHKGHSVWGQFACKLLQPAQPPHESFFLWPKPGGHDDEAHPPIHPTKCVELSSLEHRERQLYELVVRHFLACCSRDAEGSTTTAKVLIPTVADPGNDTAGVAGVGEVFSASGTVIKQRNYLEIYKYEKWHGSEIPDLAVGELVEVSRLEMTAGRTSAPQPLSESDLISEMDRNKIGTDATIATHIATIIAREYVVQDNSGGGNRLVPTPLGQALCEAFNSMGYQLNKPFLRAQMERDCTRIARGELAKDQMLRECLSTMKTILRKCVQEVRLLDAAMAKHFAPLGGAPPGAGPGGAGAAFTVLNHQFGACGRCRNNLQLREAQAGGQGPGPRSSPRYLHCEACALTLLLPRTGEFQLLTDASSGAPMLCPLCQFQVISVTSTDPNKRPHNVCSHCFSTPPAPPDAEEGVIGEFRCFTCAHANCALAGRAGQVQGGLVTCNLAAGASRCPDGLIQLKRGERSFSIVCSKFPHCGNKFASRWLPKAIKSAVPLPQEVCTRCSPLVQFPVVKLRVELTQSMIPMHMRGDESGRLVCLCCSSFWRDMDEAAPLAALAPTAGAGGGAGAGGPPASMSTFLNGYHIQRASAAANPPAPAAGASRAGGRAEPRGGMQVDYEQGGPNNDYAAAAVGIRSLARSYGSGSGGSGVGSGGSGGGSGAGGTPMCLCGMPSVRLTVHKEGPTKGRIFYKCNNGSACKFFEWGDEAGGGSSGGYGGGGGQSDAGGYGDYDGGGGGGDDYGSYGGASASSSSYKARSGGGRGGGRGRWGGRYRKKS